MTIEAAVLVPVEASHAESSEAQAGAHADPEAKALAHALAAAEGWPAQIISLALASLGDIRLPEPAVPPRNSAVLSALPVLYWVYGLDQAGLLRAAETIGGLWASGAIAVPLPDHGVALQNYWKARRERLSTEERAHIFQLVFDARDFEPAMRRLCEALVALADNAGQRDLREEVGLGQAASRLLDLCATRLEGAPLFAATDLLAQTRQAIDVLSQRALQTAFAVRDFYALIDLNGRTQGIQPGHARAMAERAQAGAAVLRWLAQAAASHFAIDPRAAALQTLIADAERWLLSTGSAPLARAQENTQGTPTERASDDDGPRPRAAGSGEPAHEHDGVGANAV